MHLPTFLARARRSAFTRWWLNQVLDLLIPFNAPHGFKVRPLPQGGMQVRIPWWRVNRNHIRGIHACALATGAELCSGLSLLEHIDPKRYRLIMRSLHMDYHYQAKTAALATAPSIAGDIARALLQPLENGAAVDHVSRVELHDAQGKHVASATITWQVKRWEQVRTRR